MPPTQDEKKYGKANRVAPGGRTVGIDSETAKQMVRKDDDVEPVFYWTFGWQLFDDVLCGLGARSVTVLTLVRCCIFIVVANCF